MAGFLAPASVENFRADPSVGYAGAAAMFVAYGVGGAIGNELATPMAADSHGPQCNLATRLAGWEGPEAGQFSSPSQR